MRLLPLTLVIIAILAAAGCNERAPDPKDSSPQTSSVRSADTPRETVDERPTEEVQPDSGVVTFNTGDLDEWPPFDGPLHITLPPAEVPEQIRGPFAVVETPEE